MVKNLTVPDSEESATISDRNIAGVKEKPAMSVSIVETTAPGASQRNSYRPSPEKALANSRAKGGIPPSRKGNSTGRIEKIHGVDYMSAADTAKKTKVGRSEVMSLAKELWDEQKDTRSRYQQAQKIMEEASEEEIANPDDRLKRAIKMVERGILSKEDLKQSAKNILSQQKRSNM